VTASAFQWRVAPKQCEVGLFAVVEASALPPRGAVALAARRPQSPAMCVVELMAERAVPGGGVETLLRVAERAVGVGVAPFERKARRGVVEARCRPPGGRVTSLARVTERAPVGVVLAVTINTIAGRFAISLADRMALSTGRSLVSAVERHIRAPMVEGLREQHHDRRVGPLVLGVAGAAESRGADRKTAVKAERGLDVLDDRFVAHEAEVILGTSVEALMTRAAAPRLALVRSDEVAR
jgi:hypothetical protein